MWIVQIGFIVNHPMTHHVIENRERERQRDIEENIVLDTIQHRTFLLLVLKMEVYSSMNYPSYADKQKHINLI